MMKDKVPKAKKSTFKFKNLYETNKVQKHSTVVPNPTFHNTRIKYNTLTGVIGGTGAGKSHWVANFLVASPGTFEHVVVCYRDIDEPLYQTIKDEIGKKGKVSFFTFDTMPDVHELNKMREDPKDEYLVIFDDFLADLNPRSLKLMKAYAIVGRKEHMTMFWLCQSVTDTPMCIRKQLHYLVLLRLSNNRDLDRVLKEYGCDGLDKRQLREMHEMATAEPLHALKIETQGTDLNEKYTRNFTDPFYVKRHFLRNGDVEATVTPGSWYKGVRHFKSDSDSSEADDDSEDDSS